MQQLIEDLKEASARPLQDPVDADDQQSETTGNLQHKIRDELAALEPLSITEFHAEQLDLIGQHIKQWSEGRIFEEFAIYLQEVFSAPSEVRRQTGGVRWIGRLQDASRGERSTLRYSALGGEILAIVCEQS